MKLNRIRFLDKLLITQINNLVFYPFAMTIATLFEDVVAPERPSVLIWMIAGLIPLGLSYARRYINNIIPFTFLHVVGFCSYLVLSFLLSPNGSTSNRVYFLFVGIGFIIYSMYLRLATENFEDSPIQMPFAVGFTAVSLYIQHYQNNTAWDNYYKISLIMILAFYFVNYYIREYLNFLIVNSSSTGILPEQEIFRSGMRLTLLYTMLGAVILIATAQFTWLKQLLYSLKQLIYNIIRFIFSHFTFPSASGTEITREERGDGGFSMLPEPGEPGMFWKIFEIIALIAMVIVVSFLIYRALKTFIAYVNKMMSKHAMLPKEIDTTQAVDVREKCEITRNNNRRKSPLEFFGFLDTKERIRRIYKKAVSSYKPSSLFSDEKEKKDEFIPERLAFYTAREMGKRMETTSMADIYEKARYSNETCTAQDVKLMKDACKS